MALPARRASPSRPYVHSYPTTGGLRRDTERLMAAGWKIEAQVAAGKRVVVTWVKA